MKIALTAGGTLRYPTPGVLQKSPDLIDCKGLDFFVDDKEFAKV